MGQRTNASNGRQLIIGAQRLVNDHLPLLPSDASSMTFSLSVLPSYVQPSHIVFSELLFDVLLD